jgi:membrane protein implicated in regulation of membrane protease activity
VVLALRRLPNPRLTGLGSGLFAAMSMFALGCLDRLLFGGSPVVYGVLFLPVSLLTALWVRPADLVTAPISVPIAFACGLLPIAGGSDGVGSRFMAVVTALAVHAGWLYGGTLIAGLIASVRKIRLMGRKRRQQGMQQAGQQTAQQAGQQTVDVQPAVAGPAVARPQAAAVSVRTRPKSKPAAVRRQR